jgi:predicted acyl esterase
LSEVAVEFAATDGSRLRGLLHLPTRAPAPGFICIHGLTLNHEMFAELGRRAADAGIACLRFHMRGHGDSEGALEAQGFEDEVADARNALEYLAARPELDAGRLGVLGFSLGGAVAAVLSARMEFKALATWASLLDTQRWTSLRYEQYGRPFEGMVRIWDEIPVSESLFDQAIALDPFTDVLDFKGPYFAAHGGRDRNHPQEKSIEAVELRLARGLPSEGYFPSLSGHKFQIPEDQALLVKKTLSFFKASL